MLFPSVIAQFPTTFIANISMPTLGLYSFTYMQVVKVLTRVNWWFLREQCCQDGIFAEMQIYKCSSVLNDTYHSFHIDAYHCFHVICNHVSNMCCMVRELQWALQSSVLPFPNINTDRSGNSLRIWLIADLSPVYFFLQSYKERHTEKAHKSVIITGLLLNWPRSHGKLQLCSLLNPLSALIPLHL